MNSTETPISYISVQNAFTTRKTNKAFQRQLEKKLAEDARVKHYFEQVERCKTQVNNLLRTYILHGDTCVDIPNIVESDNSISLGITYECYKDDYFVKYNEYDAVRGLNNITSIASKLTDYLSENYGFTSILEKRYYSLDGNAKVQFFISIYLN